MEKSVTPYIAKPCVGRITGQLGNEDARNIKLALKRSVEFDPVPRCGAIDIDKCEIEMLIASDSSHFTPGRSDSCHLKTQIFNEPRHAAGKRCLVIDYRYVESIFEVIC
jgi:Zn-finger nucleic acid-binding protein